MLQKTVQWVAHWLRSFNPYVPEKLGKDELQPVRVEEASIRKQASTYILVAFAVFFAWALTAPLDAGVSVSGTVVVLGNRKAVQHPSGGVVEELLVREGSHVTQGDTLIRVNPLSVEANLHQAEAEYINVLAAYSRLMAEREKRSVIAWDVELQAFGDKSEVQAARQFQESLFNSRRSEFNDQARILAEQQSGLLRQIAELKNILTERKLQLQLLTTEVESNEELAKDGFISRSRFHELSRARSDIQANVASTLSEIARVEASIASNRLEITKLSATYLKDVDQQLTDVQKNRLSLKGRVESLRFDQSLAAIKAPASGTVVGLKAHTIGGVIRGGDILLEIVPESQSLVAEVAIPPHLIDKVKVGLGADMRFSAFNVNTTPVIPGKVRMVGADRLPPSPPQHPEEYYLAQVETTEEGTRLLRDKVIQPGMPVEVIVKTGERTFMSYLLKPLTDRFARSFKED